MGSARPRRRGGRPPGRSGAERRAPADPLPPRRATTGRRPPRGCRPRCRQRPRTGPGRRRARARGQRPTVRRRGSPRPPPERVVGGAPAAEADDDGVDLATDPAARVVVGVEVADHEPAAVEEQDRRPRRSRVSVSAAVPAQGTVARRPVDPRRQRSARTVDRAGTRTGPAWPAHWGRAARRLLAQRRRALRSGGRARARRADDGRHSTLTAIVCVSPKAVCTPSASCTQSSYSPGSSAISRESDPSPRWKRPSASSSSDGPGITSPVS
jgi:hypothetical protein